MLTTPDAYEKHQDGLALAHREEVGRGDRFEFGKNWRRYLSQLNERQIAAARDSLAAWIDAASLEGATFLDVGCGSGLFSLAACQLGAQVLSFDFDPDSVACALSLREKFVIEKGRWRIVQGSVLDHDFLATLGRFDIVYSWGVLHHTGNMWQAIANAADLVASSGRLWLAIYNDQGRSSRRWLWVKQMYNQLPPGLRWAVLYPAAVRLRGPTIIRDALSGQPLASFRQYQSASRGMSPWRDIVDWVGGYPFEVAKPEEVFRFLRQRGFSLRELRTCAGGHGCNEFLFTKSDVP